MQQTIELEELIRIVNGAKSLRITLDIVATQVLTKSDRASMSHSIIRCPYLDWELFSETFFPRNTFPFLSGRKQVFRIITRIES